MKYIQQKNIIHNGLSGTDQNTSGKIVKIVVILKEESENLSMDFYTNDREFMLGVVGFKEGFNIYYPTHTTDEEFQDYFYNIGPVIFDVKNLQDEKSIPNIIIYYTED